MCSSDWEARELAALRAQFFSDGGSDDEGADSGGGGNGNGPDFAAGDVSPRQLGRAGDDQRDVGAEEQEDAPRGKHRVQNCIRLAREKSYGRVFEDPFSAAAVLLVLPFLPPLSVYLTFRECGGLNGQRSRIVWVCTLLTVLGWVPGVGCESYPSLNLGMTYLVGDGEIDEKLTRENQMPWWCTSGTCLDRPALRRTRH